MYAKQASPGRVPLPSWWGMSGGEPGCPFKAYLHLDFLPVLISELRATLFIQLLKNASIYSQAVVDLCKELFYVGVVGAQYAVTDLEELRTEELG